MGSRHGVFPKRQVESGPGNAAGKNLRLSETRRSWRDLTFPELRRLAEEGKASGLSKEDGESVLDRLEAKYRGLIARKPGA